MASPFVLFYAFGALCESSCTYAVKAVCIGIALLAINVSSRFCTANNDNIMKYLPVSVYLATKVRKSGGNGYLLNNLIIV